MTTVDLIDLCYKQLAIMAQHPEATTWSKTLLARAMHGLAEVVAVVGDSLDKPRSVYPPGWGPPSDTPIPPCGNVLPVNMHQEQEA
jgi:hypothetical protein